MAKISISEAIKRYKHDRSSLIQLEDKILSSCLFLDAVVTKLSEDKIGKQYLEKAKIEISLQFEQNKTYGVSTLKKYFATFLDIPGFSDKYFCIYSISESEAKKKMDELFPDMWDKLYSEEDISPTQLSHLKEFK